MTSRELRQSFLDYFAKRDHRILPGAPLKPTEPTTLFTSAGMQPFVPWFRGLIPPAAPRVATCQKCFRADDVDEVGHTPVHCTFFEMLGNFSFGDYFKRDAIAYAWEYVTKVLALPKSHIWVTVHPDDDESPGFWREVTGLPDDRIVPDPTNWWGPVGNSGPCGPCSEVYLDLGEDRGCGNVSCGPLCDCNRMDEFWNLVFQMYNKTESGELEPLPKPGIDTGMGLERLARLMQDVPTIFETDLLAPIVAAVIAQARSTNPELPERLDDSQHVATRVIAEHTRALAFLLADGFTPSNEGAGYVLRRLLRRAYRFGRALGIEEPFLHALTPAVVATMGPDYPELRATQSRIQTWLEQEEKQFEETLERGLGPLMTAIEKAQAAGLKVLPGDEAFKLYDTYGLPWDIIAETASQHGLAVDRDVFDYSLEVQRTRGRDRAVHDFAFTGVEGYGAFTGRTKFTGYSACITRDAAVIGILVDGVDAARWPLRAGQIGHVILDRTPFYAESGGQVGDTGILESDDVAAEVVNTVHPPATATPTYDPGAVIVHQVRVIKGELRFGQKLRAEVDQDRRQAIARAHTATHLLHHMLRKVLGEHAVQSGSLVDADTLRFDFAHFGALTAEERRRIEDGVVELSLRDEPLDTEEMRLEDAKRVGATALFGEKYGEFVRVVRIGEFSKELCGGTHLAHSGAIGGFTIVSEHSVGSNLRRIEAVTGREAQALAVRQREMLESAAELLKCRPEEIAEHIQALRARMREKERLADHVMLTVNVVNRAEQLAGQALDVNGVKLITARVDGMSSEAMRALSDDLRARLGSGIVVLGAVIEGSVQFVGAVSKDLVDKGYHAGNLIREVAKIAGGGGGGRPDFAQAGGKDPERLDEALAKAKELVAGQKA